MYADTTGDLRVTAQAHAHQRVANEHCDFAGVHDGCRIAGVEVEHQHRGMFEIVGVAEIWMQFDGGQIGGPDEPREIVDDDCIDVLPGREDVHALHMYPRWVRWRARLEERRTANAAGK